MSTCDAKISQLTEMIARDWLLVTAGTAEHYNPITVNWVTCGYLWMKPVITIFIRPERYTYQLLEQRTLFTASFFAGKQRDALNFCAGCSGREVKDKAVKAGLTAFVTAQGNIGYQAAELVLDCRVLYAQALQAPAFLEPAVLENYYRTGGLHKMYVAEIVDRQEPGRN
ncbi:MAG: flavin reductase family protein [Oligosphaeraceae bacterium]|nr:flavin reductase family protein [Oligosphaeraceae bacterium]